MEQHKIGTLYLVPTPIGNLEDITYRAVRVLQEVDLIAAEDTRHTGLLLKHLDISTPLTSYHEHNKLVKGEQLIDDLLQGKDIAVVSDAGMPAISDPGAELVEMALAAQVDVVPLPGPNAALTALIASGLSAREFTFIGFLPKKSSHQQELLQRIKGYEGTLIFYEAPHRLISTLKTLYEGLGNRPIVLARELTKRFEEFLRSDLRTVVAEFDELVTQKGEFVLLVGGCATSIETDVESTDQAISLSLTSKTATPSDYVALVHNLMEQGLSKKDAAREVAKKLGVSRRVVYNAVEEFKEITEEDL
ncbi:16S rRNA (cytidine(1402)-2'-O)-methyltransferase [uncultured Veillonella sp.]|uniref:16S rRNA (cytidine(1402)-2'-O)-methyltransferase n=1 Tax=uncultured Veillonella sp. TaxID=159268 RepID=UPI0025E748CA|nr:16S rRNA (cytidine(1402)-2'-O)-methyltransferase [uncultured Veillonella sp.]MDY3974771.1 16S rRNA (cytidine(1402)-2'-O)-methyltransferase [Veillonella caviae]